MDLSMEPGVDFVDHIHQAVGSCRVLIAVIGPRWATVENAHGQRRLDDPTDFIRIEVEAGLEQPDVRVVPVLVQGATMPGVDELPQALANLARRNALELSDARWGYDVERLASTAARVLDSDVRRSPAPQRLDQADSEGGRGGVRLRSEQPRTDLPVDGGSRARQAVPSRLRRHWRLALAVPVVAALVGVLAVIEASGGDDDGSPESRLLKVIPVSVQAAGCDRAHGKAFWMKTSEAVAQYNCPQLPSSVTSEAVPEGSLVYGLFPSASQAQGFVESDFRDALNQKSKSPRLCRAEATAELETDYPDGDAACYENEDGIVINWSYPESAVAVQLYFAPGTSLEAAVKARAKLL